MTDPTNLRDGLMEVIPLPKRPTDIGPDRICTQCGIAKERTPENFKLSKQCLGGLSGWCRLCSASYSRSWKGRRSDEQRKRRQELYALRPDARAVYERNLAALQWKNDPIRKRSRIMVEGMRERSKRCAVPFDVRTYTVSFMAAWLRAYPKCPCCGVTYAIEPGGRSGPSNQSPSVDQIAPGEGYVSGNVALLCWRCNNLKRDASALELEKVARWMHEAASTTPSREDIAALTSQSRFPRTKEDAWGLQAPPQILTSASLTSNPDSA